MIREKYLENNPKPITVCVNHKCEWPIYKGDKVWKHVRDLYCHINCFLDSLKGNKHE